MVFKNTFVSIYCIESTKKMQLLRNVSNNICLNQILILNKCVIGMMKQGEHPEKISEPLARTSKVQGCWPPPYSVCFYLTIAKLSSLGLLCLPCLFCCASVHLSVKTENTPIPQTPWPLHVLRASGLNPLDTFLWISTVGGTTLRLWIKGTLPFFDACYIWSWGLYCREKKIFCGLNSQEKLLL